MFRIQLILVAIAFSISSCGSSTPEDDHDVGSPPDDSASGSPDERSGDDLPLKTDLTEDDITSFEDGVTPPEEVAQETITPLPASAFSLVDTNQTNCYGLQTCEPCPAPGESLHGQDAWYSGNQAQYQVSQDGLTVYDVHTGLTWQQAPDTDGNGEVTVLDKLTWEGAKLLPGQLNAASFGGYDDWRLPTIKEMYSLIQFSGTDPSGYEGTDTSGLVPFIDDSAFDFAYGDLTAGERIIDSQYASSTLYVSNTGGDGGGTLFGVNMADGRIKGYGLLGPDGKDKTFFVQCVRGNTDYGVNDFEDNGDGTVDDNATGLMWQTEDSAEGMLWADALALCESLELAGHDDWRLPDAKELQSIVDYTRSPDTTDSAAIDPLFTASTITNEAGQPDYAFYWTSTTHVTWLSGSEGAGGAYVAFGRSLGYMNNSWVDVHGAGSQRSDPKVGDPADYPFGHGPQGDAIRIYNHVRCVRGGVAAPGADEGECPDVQEPQCGDGVCSPGEEQTCMEDCQDNPPGPTPCTTQEECEQPGACPPEAVLGCTCSETPDGKLCIPACENDTDCPSPPGMTLTCNPDGVCVPG